MTKHWTKLIRFNVLSRSALRRINEYVRILALLVACVTPTLAKEPAPGASQTEIRDIYLKQWMSLTYDQTPPRPVPGEDYGMDAETGEFKAPIATPLDAHAPGFPGQLEYWDQKSYANNVNVIAFYPYVTSPWHAWANVADFGGRRYLYTHDRDYLRVLDVTNPSEAEVVYSDGGVWGPWPAH